MTVISTSHISHHLVVYPLSLLRLALRIEKLGMMRSDRPTTVCDCEIRPAPVASGNYHGLGSFWFNGKLATYSHDSLLFPPNLVISSHPGRCRSSNLIAALFRLQNLAGTTCFMKVYVDLPISRECISCLRPTKRCIHAGYFLHLNSKFVSFSGIGCSCFFCMLAASLLYFIN